MGSRIRIAIFQSHPIQYYTPLWAELSRRPGVELTVFYFSRHALEVSRDPGFGVDFAWDVDLLAGHEHEFLPRQWPTEDRNDCTWKGLNQGMKRALARGWDVVFVSGWAHLNNWMILRYCRSLDLPLLVHSDVSILTAFRKNWFKLLAKRIVLTHFLKRVGAGLAVGDHARAFLVEYGVPPDRAFIAPLPIDVGRFRRSVEAAPPDTGASLRRRYGISADKRIIVFSGKLISRKRPQDLIEAIQRLNRDDVVGLMIGEGPMRVSLEARAQKNIVFTGFVNQREMPLLVSTGYVSVMPSSYDAHPFAVSESLCLGVPVVSSDLCGCYGPNDILRDGENGLVYPSGDIEALTEHLRVLLDNPHVHARMSRRACELADTQAPGAAADAFLRAVHEVLGPAKQLAVSFEESASLAEPDPMD